MELKKYISVIAAMIVLAATDCAADIPSLSKQQQLAAEIAVDDRDWNDAAFAALVENARLWREPIGDVLARNDPDFAAMMDKPDNYHGDLCLLRGVIQQTNRLGPPYGDIAEWFIRDEDGRPIQVFVVLPEVANPAVSFGDGSRVELYARFYKRTLESEARDGKSHQYPAFIGALPRPARIATTSIGFPAWLPVAVILLLVIFGVLLARVRKLRRTAVRHEQRRLRDVAVEVETLPLPENPADALAELRRRAGE